MADYRDILRSLEELNPYERYAGDLKQHSGSPLSYAQYIYLVQHGIDGCTPIDLESHAAQREQQDTLESFHGRYAQEGLSERDFFSPGSDIEAQQLLRYIDIPPHAHRFAECAFVLEGSCIHHVGKNEVIQKAGSFVLIPPLTQHHLVAVDNAVCLTVKAKVSLILRLSIPQLPSMAYPLSFSCGDDDAVRSMLLFLYQQQNSALPYHEKLMELTFTALITYILQSYSATMQPLYSLSIKDQQLLDMVNYMYNNYQTITLQKLAEEFHYNEAYLSRMFHQQTGQSFSETVRDFKLKKAGELLKSTDWKLGQICDSIGYRDTRQFIRSFKKLYGTTPQSYREKARTEELDPFSPQAEQAESTAPAGR